MVASSYKFIYAPHYIFVLIDFVFIFLINLVHDINATLMHANTSQNFQHSLYRSTILTRPSVITQFQLISHTVRFREVEVGANFYRTDYATRMKKTSHDFSLVVDFINDNFNTFTNMIYNISSWFLEGNLTNNYSASFQIYKFARNLT